MRDSLERRALGLLGGLGLVAALVLLAPLSPTASAQTYRDAPAGKAGSLPHAMTPEEEAIRDLIGAGHRTTPPPGAQPVRNLAEFERMQGVLIRYPLSISVALVAEMSEDAIVYCAVTASQQPSAESAFSSGGVNMDHVEWLIATTDSEWTRDYGPWFIIDANGDLAIIDTIYNRPRPNDDEIPQELGDYLGLPVYGPDLIHTGGNWMTDGHGTAISTTLAYTENPDKTIGDIEAIVDDYLGIETYHCYPDVNGEYIEHIDCWAKYLAVDKILIREVPPEHSQYDEIEAAVDYFAAQLSAYGTPYQICRVWTPGDEPYTNSLILNEKVLVPIEGGSHPDAQALAAYEAAMPGYEVIGFTGSWYSTDALHCRTHGVGDPGYLYVYSIPLRTTADDQSPHRVAAEISDYSDAGLIPGDLRVYWRPDTTGAFVYEAMSAIAGTDSFYADIPAQPLGTTIEYYVHAADYSGRGEDYPLVGPDGPFRFDVRLITATTELAWTDDTSGPYGVSCEVTDSAAVAAIDLYYRVNGGAFTALPMSPQGDDIFHAGIPGQLYTSHIEYYVRAEATGGSIVHDPPTAPGLCFDFYVIPRTHLLTADMEGGSDWTHGVVTGGFGDQWHLSTQRNHTPGGTTSWKCGDPGVGEYANELDAGLVTIPVELGENSELVFWHWVAAETSVTHPGYAYDGGLLEIDAGQGWEILAPAGGYPFLIRDSSGPFPPETGIFSGHHDWQEVTVSLAAHTGSAQIRFRFGSDGADTDEGWYIDDVTIDGFQIDPQALPESATLPLTRLMLTGSRPSPMSRAAWFQLALPRGGRTRLQIYDSAGRLVRTLADRDFTAGDHRITWDGADTRGQRVAGGLYFLRLKTGHEDESRRIVVID
ncbi:MAG: agmatine deiminase family protein [Candidatus Eisenbacteria sp.]|nr:agmatine deiminase family protein [Candidatus Eisenbacteria bacterium]